MATENEVDVILTASVDPSVARAFKQFLSEVSGTSNEAKKIIADWSKFATSVAIQVANTESVVTKEQVKQFAQGIKEKTQYERSFTSGVQKEIKARVASYNAADKERLQFFKLSQAEALREMSTSEKEMVRLHSEAIKENERIDREYWKNRERLELEGRRILTQMNKDQAKYLNPTPGGGGAGSNANPLSSLLSTGAMGLMRQFLPVMLAYRAFRGAINFEKEGVAISDEIRDVDAAIKAYSSSQDQATRSLKFFTDAQERSRSTSLELKKIYTEILPKGQTAGLSEATLRNASVDISNIAAFRKNTSTEALTNGLRNVIGGRIVGSNPLLASIGMTIEQVKEMHKNGDDVTAYVIQKMHEVAAEARKQGDSLESIWKKTKFNIMDSFAQGFNSARGSAVSGMEGIKSVLNDPSFLNFIKMVGFATTKAMTTIAFYAKASIDMMMLTFDTLKVIISASILTILGGIQKLIAGFNAVAQAFPKSTFLLTGQSASQWAESKRQIDSFVKYWSDSTVNAAQDMAKRVPKLALNTVNWVLGMGVHDGSPDFKPSANPDDADGYDLGKDPSNSPNAKAAARAQKKLEKAGEKIDNYIAGIRDRVNVIKEQAKLVTESEKTFKGSPLEAFLMYQKDLASDVKEVNTAFRGLSGAIDTLGSHSDKVDDLRKALAELRKELDNLAKNRYDTRFTAEMDRAIAKFDTKALKDALAGMARADHSTLTDARAMHKGSAVFDKVYDKWNKEDLAGVKRIDAETLKDERKKAQEYAKEVKKAQKELQIFESGADDFVAAILTGGKGFGRAAANEFNSLTKEGAKDIIGKMVEFASGVKQDDLGNYLNSAGQVIKDKNGNAVTNMSEAVAVGGNKTNMAKLQNGMALAQIGFGSYSNAKANPEGSMTAGIAGGFMAGLSTGNIYVAIAGAIIGGIGAAIGKAAAQDQYKYAKFNISDKGVVTASQVQEITPAAMKQMTAQVQETFDDVWNSLVKIMISVKGVIPSIKEIDGTIQPNPSKNYLKHFDEWISNTLPTQLVGLFKGGMENAATHLGMSAARFTEIWNHFSNIDPKKMVDALQTLFEALTNFREVLQFINGSIPLPDYTGLVPVPGRGRAVRPPHNPSDAWQEFQKNETQNILYPTFASQTLDARNKMVDLGKSLNSLTGASQIQAARELSTMMVDYMTTSKNFMRDLVLLSHEIDQQVQSMIQDLVAQGLTKTDENGQRVPDYQAQAEYWKQIADSILHKIQTDTTPDQVNKDWQDYLKAIGNVQNAQSQLGPENAEAARQWMIQALQMGNQYFQDAIKRIGDDVNKINDWINTQLGPYITQFTSILQNAGDAVGGIIGPIDELPDPINKTGDAFNNIIVKINNASDALDIFSSKLSSWTPPSGGNGGDDGGSNNKNQTVDFYPFLAMSARASG
jgi:hypothetical protein